MGKRRMGREFAVQVLYGIDVSGEEPEGAIARHRASFDVDSEAAGFAQSLIHGVVEHREALDTRIARASRNWRLDRMSTVDRNILRVALYEMIYSSEVPPVVAINEAIEIAKAYGTEASPPFINGILDQAAATITTGAAKSDSERKP